MEYDLRNTIACLLQSCDHLENRGSEDNKMSRRMWEAGETKAEKARIAKIKKKEKREEEGRKQEEKEQKKEKEKKKRKSKKKMVDIERITEE